MAHITVDGTVLTVQDGALLIEELLKNGIHIPHFCYHPALGKDGNCRMCMVEIEGQKRPQIACDTPIKDGMIVRTKGANIDRVKRSILELELINHPIDCPVCDQAGECQLQNYYMDVGLYESRLSTPKVHGQKRVDLGANVVLDQERCVLCTRCVRFTQNITHSHELGVLKRSDHSVITLFPGTQLSNPYAMNVVDLCPVGALTSKDFRFQKRVWFLQTQEAICNRCARGCSIYVDHHGEKYKNETIYRYRPRLNEKVNGYFICDAGRLSYKKENEQTHFKAQIRGKQSEYDYALGKLTRLMKRHLSHCLILVSPHMSLEELARAQEIARQYQWHISAYGALKTDEAFGDSFLKCNDITPNAKAIALLGIDATHAYVQEALRSATLVVWMGRNDLSLCETQLPRVVLSGYALEEEAMVELLLPIAGHTARSGSFINADGYVQYSACHLRQEDEHKPLLEVLANIANDTCFTCKEVWEQYLVHQPALQDITFETLSLTPKVDE